MTVRGGDVVPAGPGRRRPVIALLTATVLLLTACGRGDTAPRPPEPPTADPAAEQRYGAAPTSDPGVTYQPDVVFVGGGGASVRGLSADALTWRIDPRASGANTLARGKV
ncbi:hypothetical protein KBX53_29470, partial [Micromonospora sp. M51]|nr:hypothetical protein [Micromonospora sp. M51]